MSQNCFKAKLDDILAEREHLQIHTNAGRNHVLPEIWRRAVAGVMTVFHELGWEQAASLSLCTGPGND